MFKDIFPRYKTMRGYYVERKGGWDCHGLPVEIAVEQELGLAGKPEIEAYGIAEFNAKCRESVFRHVEEWNRLTERIGFWIDLDDAYRTLDTTYVESVWWALKSICDKGLLYEGDKVVPYCSRCGTLSSHEVGQPGAYRDVEDPSVYVRFPVVEPAGALRAGDELLVWTTTPWTLVSNAAVAVDPELEYVRTSRRATCSPPRWSSACSARTPRSLDRFPGAELDRRALRAAVRVHPGRATTGPRATPSCPPTSSPPTTAPASCTRRSPSARTTSASGRSRAWPSSTRSGSTAPTTSASGPTPGAGSRTPTAT